MSPALVATAELSLATTLAANLHRAPTLRQLRARHELACIASRTAYHAALVADLEVLAGQAADLLAQLEACTV